MAGNDPLMNALNYGAHWLTGKDPGWNRQSSGSEPRGYQPVRVRNGVPLPQDVGPGGGASTSRSAVRSAPIGVLREQQNRVIRQHDANTRPDRRLAPAAPPARDNTRMNTLDSASPAPARAAARVAPAPARPQASPATPAAQPPASTAAAATPTSTPAAAYKPVADLGAARRAAFMGAGDTAQGMVAVRKLLAAEAGVENFNSRSVAELEQMALKRREGTNWAAQVPANALSTPVDVKAFTNPAMQSAAGTGFDSSRVINADFSQASNDQSFGRDFAVPSGGSPLTRDLTPVNTSNWMSGFTTNLLQQDVLSGNYKTPVDVGAQKPLVFGDQSAAATNPSALIEAYHNAGEKAPITPATAAMQKAVGPSGLLGGERQKRQGRNLGFELNLPPQVAPLSRNAVAGLPR